MLNKIRKRYHYMPTRMAKLKKKNQKTTGNSMCPQECGTIGTLVLCWWDCKHSIARESYFGKQFLIILNIYSPFNPIMPLRSIYPREIKIYTTKDLSRMFIVPLTTIGKTWKQPKCLSRGEWIHQQSTGQQ